MTTRPAHTLAWIFGIALLVAAPGIVPVALTVITWTLATPIVLGVGLAVTLAWCVVRPVHRHGRWA